MESIVYTNSDIISSLLNDATSIDNDDRRAEQRHPFFCPLRVTVGDKTYSAFARDISATGIGILHNVPLECGRVSLTIDAPSGRVQLPGQIMWFQPCGEGWYLSGAQFL